MDFKNKKRISFENKILSIIYGAALEESVWRIKHNKEISELFLAGLFRGSRLRWTKYILRKNTEKITKIIYESLPEPIMPKGRPRAVWEDQVHRDMQK